MNTYSQMIDSLDVAVFEAIPSATLLLDRRSLLAIHRATARKHAGFSYLEIGSYLGGTIQPYLLDDRCARVYSIDPRPLQQPDDRVPGAVWYYEDNSTQKMLSLLEAIGHGDIDKIECIESDASAIDRARIRDAPEILFIDGEHTRAAALSDFRFCEEVASPSATIVFHDFPIIYPAIVEACKYLDRKRRSYIPLKLEGSVFALFFDADKVDEDPYLASELRRNRYYLRTYGTKSWLKRVLPGPAITAMRSVRNRSVVSTIRRRNGAVKQDRSCHGG